MGFDSAWAQLMKSDIEMSMHVDALKGFVSTMDSSESSLQTFERLLQNLEASVQKAEDILKEYRELADNLHERQKNDSS